MKTLKKTLSLTLVFALVFSLMSMAFAAETTTTSTSATGFTDEASIQYKEAVDVMTGIGAINGYTDGSVKPQGSITREEAAKMISYAVLGKDVADKLSVSNTGFTDVASDRWSAPYIAYLVGEGVISGMGDGTFAPTANVTGYQMAKMMLCAAGYGAKGEFTGNGWELPVAVAANKAGIFDSAKATDYTKAATREEAMLYAFNGITKVPQVFYNKLTETYTKDTVAATNVVGDEKVLDDNYVQIAEEVYPTLTANTGTVNGRAVRFYTYKSKTITEYTPFDTVLATSTKGTELTNLISKGSTGYAGYALADEVKLYVNGTADTTDADHDGVFESTDLAALKTAGDAAVEVGSVVLLISSTDANKVDTITITNYTLSKVTAATAEKADGTEATVTITGANGGSAIKESDFISGFSALAKGDHVMYAATPEGYIAYEPTTITGTMTKVNAVTHAMTIDGTVYYASAAANNLSYTQAQSYTGTSNATFFVDANGYIVATTGIANTNYAVIDSIALVPGSGVSTADTVQAKLVFADASTKIVNVASIDGYNAIVAVDSVSTYVTTSDGTTPITTTTPAKIDCFNGTTAVKALVLSTTASANASAFAGEIYTYAENASGNYVLNKVATGAGSSTDKTASVAITKGVPAIAATTPAAGNNGTVYVVKTVSGGVASFAKYTGFSNVPSVDSAAVDYVATATSGVVFCYVDASAATSVGDTTNNNVVFFWNNAFTLDNTNPAKPLYEYNAILNGKQQTVIATSDLSASANTLYTATLNNAGQVTGISAVSSANFTSITVNGDVNALAGVMGIDSVTLANGLTTVQALTFTGSEKVYLVSKAGYTVTEGSFGDIADNAVAFVRTVGTASGTAAQKIAVAEIYVLVD